MIDILHVYHIPLVSTNSVLPPAMVTSILDETKASKIEKLDGLLAELNTEFQGQTHCVYGFFPSTEIVELSKKISADMIVMGLREKHGAVDRWMGSVTSHTISKSLIPVLAIPYDFTFSRIKSIVFPTKWKNPNEIDNATEDAMSFIYNFTFDSGLPHIEFVHITKGNQVNIRFKENQYVDLAFSQNYADNIDEGIVACARKRNVDLIVMQKQDRKFWQNIYHQSITKKILFKNVWPILVI